MFAAGPVVAQTGSAAACLVRDAARAAGDGAAGAQAAALADRLARLGQRDAEVLAAARTKLADVSPEGADERRDFALGRSLEEAAAIPLEIVEACADVAALARALAHLLPDAAGDLEAAALLAAGAAGAAAHLVEINLGVGADDPRLVRARRAAAGAR
jgi:formiminotetrahydrofolate cyclodeaminase